MLTTIDAAATGPSDVQRNFFVSLQQAMPSIAAIAREYVERESGVVRDVASLDAYSLEIGSDADSEAQRFVLELVEEDEIVVHRVTFEKNVPVGYTHDD